MFQFKTGVEGQEARGPAGTYWISPQRDLAYTFPVQMRKAVSLIWDYPRCSTSMAYLYDYCGTEDPNEEQLQEYLTEVDNVARAMIPLIVEAGTGHKEEGRAKSKKEAGEKTGYTQFLRDLIPNPKRRAAFNALTATLFNVIMWDYYSGVDEGFRGSYKPFLFSHPLELLDDIEERETKRES